jgi:hypothetical protein
MEANGKALAQEKVTELQANAPGTVVVMHFLKPDESKSDRHKMDRSVLFPGAAIASNAMPWMPPKGQLIEGNVWALPSDAIAHQDRLLVLLALSVNTSSPDALATSIRPYQYHQENDAVLQQIATQSPSQ